MKLYFGYTSYFFYKDDIVNVGFFDFGIIYSFLIRFDRTFY